MMLQELKKKKHFPKVGILFNDFARLPISIRTEQMRINKLRISTLDFKSTPKRAAGATGHRCSCGESLFDFQLQKKKLCWRSEACLMECWMNKFRVDALMT